MPRSLDQAKLHHFHHFMFYTRLSHLCHAYADSHGLGVTEDSLDQLLTLAFDADTTLMLSSDCDQALVTIYSTPGYTSAVASVAPDRQLQVDEDGDEVEEEWDLTQLIGPKAQPSPRSLWRVQVEPDSRLLVLSHEAELDDLTEIAFATLIDGFLAMHRMFADALPTQQP